MVTLLRPIMILIAGCAILFTTAVTTATQASAATDNCALSPNSDHCYRIANWPGAEHNDGSRGYVYLYCLYRPNTSQNFTTEEMWQGTNSDPSRSSWIETGAAYGYPQGDTCDWYWADKPPGSPYAATGAVTITVLEKDSNGVPYGRVNWTTSGSYTGC